MTYYAYILKCSDNSLYVGSTNDIYRRLHAHNTLKSGAHYTKIRRPVEIIHTEKFKTYSEARKREAEIKRFSRGKKLALIQNKSKQNMEITYGIHKSPFGLCLLGITKEGIVRVTFLEKDNDKIAISRIQEVSRGAKIIRDDKKTKEFFKTIFKPGKQKLKVVFSGTEFQEKVWNALLQIPRGKTSTYSEIAKKIGHPKAVRAVGTACGKNNLAYVIPCHRVIAQNRKLGGYATGLKRKIQMLDYESKLATKI